MNLLAAQNTASLSGRNQSESGSVGIRRVDLDNPFDGYETHTPKYFPRATAECVRTGQNLDLSDPQTRVYVRALDTQIFKDIGKGATVGSLVTPVGPAAAALTVLGAGTALAESAASTSALGTARDKVIEEVAETSCESIIRELLGQSPAVAARLAALINLAGGWEAFRARAKTELLGIKANADQ